MRRILIVEDDCIIALVIQRSLVSRGFDVVGVVQTGEEAVIRSTQEQVDAVIMDIHLSGKMDGFQATRIIHQIKKIPIIFTSGDDLKDLPELLYEQAACRFLSKPVNPSELIAIVSAMLPAG